MCLVSLIWNRVTKTHVPQNSPGWCPGTWLSVLALELPVYTGYYQSSCPVNLAVLSSLWDPCSPSQQDFYSLQWFGPEQWQSSCGEPLHQILRHFQATFLRWHPLALPAVVNFPSPCEKASSNTKQAFKAKYIVKVGHPHEWSLDNGIISRSGWYREIPLNSLSTHSQTKSRTLQ